MRLRLRRAAVALALLAPASARATEAATGLQLGYGRRIADDADRTEGLVLLGLRADVLFGRDGRDDAAWGPHTGFTSLDPFHEAQGDVGLSVLLPATEAWPVVVSASGWLGSGDGRAGAMGRVFFGPRAHNPYSAYVTTAGLFVEGRAALAGAKGFDVFAGLHLDGYALLYPFVILWEGIRHGWP